MIGVSRIIGQSTETPMPSALQFARQALGERDDTELGDAVGPEPGIAHHARERRGEHDVAIAALLDQARQERLDAVDRPPQVDVDHPAPVAVGDVGDRGGIGDARVVEHQVHLAEQAEGFVGKVLDGVQLGDVADDAVCLRAVGRSCSTAASSAVLIDVGQHDPRAATGELLRAGETDAACAAGDYRSASLECLHGAKTIRLDDGVNRRTACRGR